MSIKSIQTHYGLSWLSCIVATCIFGGELVRSSLQTNSFNLGYVEYVIPAIFILALIALYYALFTWNKKLRSGQSSELFWMIILLGLIIGSITGMYVIDAWKDIFTQKRQPDYFGDLLEGIFSTRKSEEVRTTEKILFFLYAGYTLLLFAVLVLTITIRASFKKDSPADLADPR